MALPQPSDLKTLDYVYLGAPFCDVPAKSAVVLATMDFVYLGAPFVSNDFSGLLTEKWMKANGNLMLISGKQAIIFV